MNEFLLTWAETSTMSTTILGRGTEKSVQIKFAGVAQNSEEYQRWIEKLNILEIFNGNLFCILRPL